MIKQNKLPTIVNSPLHEEILSRIPSNLVLWPRESCSFNHKALDTHQLPNKYWQKKVRWPSRPVVFISDPHADAEAFENSLIAAAVAERTKPGLRQLKLTKFGKTAEIMVGGDCLDKGPSNLELLRSLKQLYKLKAKVTLLAGNHDLRLRMGLLAISRKKDAGNQHFFVRMGKKIVPLFKEVFEQYLDGTKWEKTVPDEATCRKILFPNEDWFNEFPFHAAGFLTAEGIEREVRKMHTKVDKFERHCLEAGLTLRHVYAASMQCQKMFLDKKGEFSWFFRKMKLVEKRGSFLYLHAGLDDVMGQMLLKNGTRYANRAFHRNLQRRDLFGFYYSPLANTFRTKYRDADLPLTQRGVKAIHKAGIKVVVQGHVNQTHGQRIAIKKGLVHIEGDITLDENSRRLEALTGKGMGATIISKQLGIVGISCDYPVIKHLPATSLKHIYS